MFGCDTDPRAIFYVPRPLVRLLKVSALMIFFSRILTRCREKCRISAFLSFMTRSWAITSS